MKNRYPRNMLGYGPRIPNFHWPNGSRIAVQFVVNYEEGGENNIIHGDKGSEAFLSEIIGATSWPNRVTGIWSRSMNMVRGLDFGGWPTFFKKLILGRPFLGWLLL